MDLLFASVGKRVPFANVITLYKNKGGRSNCNSWCGVPLLNVVGTVSARVALAKQQIQTEYIDTESSDVKYLQ